MNRVPLKQIVVPLAGGACVCLAFAYFWPTGGFWLNLGTELIGILVTVLYVDWIFDRHERKRWKVADDVIRRELLDVLNDVDFRLRVALRLFDFEAAYTDSRPIELRLEQEKTTSAEKIGEQLKLLDVAGLDNLMSQLEESNDVVSRFFDRFVMRLDPQQIENLLSLMSLLGDSKWPLRNLKAILESKPVDGVVSATYIVPWQDRLTGTAAISLFMVLHSPKRIWELTKRIA